MCKKNKKTFSLLLAVLMCISCFVMPAKAATFNDINQSAIFVKQQAGDTCTLAAAVMMVRRTALASGNTNWSSITEASMKSTAWAPGLYYNFTYAGVSVGHATINSDVRLAYIDLLNKYPQGVVAYNPGWNYQSHAILLTDYDATTDTFYCSDPANNTASGRIPLNSSSIKGQGANGQNDKLSVLTEYWYVKSPSVTITKVTQPSTIIYPTVGATYKIASAVGSNKYLDFALSSNNVQIYENCDGHSDPAFVKSQYYTFVHRGDGWYQIINIGNNYAVDVAGANSASGTNIWQWEPIVYDAQLFRFYDAGNGYCYIKSKLGCYMDVAYEINENGANVWAHEFLGSTAQKWKLIKKDVPNTHTHSYTSTITTNPTCKTDGIRTYKCSCGASYTQNIGKHPATHVGGTEIRNSRASTCKETGYTGDTYCKGCGVCLGFGTSIAKNYNNHTGGTTINNAKTATCTSEGYTGDTYCKGCNTKLSSGKAIAKNLHNSNITIPEVAATCTKTGLTEGKKCSVCGTVTVAQQTVAKKAHTYTSSVTTQPTCTKDGVRTYKCSCGASYIETIAKYGHNSNTTIPSVASTCTKTGLTAGKKCSVCGTVTVAQQTVAKKAHTEVVDKAVSATCTNTGLTEGKHCSVCSTVIVAQQTVSVIDHIDNDGDYMCDYDCGFDFANFVPETPDESNAPSNDCSCMCHKSGLVGIIWKILRFFYKLFKINPVCGCGVAHY